MNGIVKFFGDKGFGFISGEDGKEYFVHQTGLPEGVVLRNGTPVTFDVVEGDRGPKAVVVRDGPLSTEELISRMQDIDLPGLLGPDGRPVSTGSQEERLLVMDVLSVSGELLRLLDENPNLIFDLSPRKFEEVVAELLDRQGYQVTLTPASNDGGIDVYAAKRNELGSFLYLVECKRYAPNNTVGVGLIRNLYGVVQAERATAGILATTSFFTKNAREFQRKVEYQVSLHDYFSIQEWIRNALQKTSL